MEEHRRVAVKFNSGSHSNRELSIWYPPTAADDRVTEKWPLEVTKSNPSSIFDNK